MSSNIRFVFTSATPTSSDVDTTMPCYKCSMLGCGKTCQECSHFTVKAPLTAPLSPPSPGVFTFNFTSPLAITLPVSEARSDWENFFTATEKSQWGWSNLEAAEPSTKISRFNWSEMDCTAHNEDSLSSPSIEVPHQNHLAECPLCSMVPYGGLCTKCNHIQTSKEVAIATPPATAWPVTTKLSDWEGTKAPEEELLRNLDMELFEQINVPHELDEWGRRVYNDCGDRILYYQDSDGNTVLGYEAWYPCSVVGDYEEPADWRAGRQTHEPQADSQAEIQEYDDCGRRIVADLDEKTVVTGYEAWYPSSETEEHEQPRNYHTTTQDDVLLLEIEQQRFAKFLAAQDDELPQFSSDRARVAAWIATACVFDQDDDISVLNSERKSMVSEWYTDYEGFESAPPSQSGGFFGLARLAERGYGSAVLAERGYGSVSNCAH